MVRLSVQFNNIMFALEIKTNVYIQTYNGAFFIAFQDIWLNTFPYFFSKLRKRMIFNHNCSYWCHFICSVIM